MRGRKQLSDRSKSGLDGRSCRNPARDQFQRQGGFAFPTAITNWLTKARFDTPALP